MPSAIARSQSLEAAAAVEGYAPERVRTRLCSTASVPSLFTEVVHERAHIGALADLAQRSVPFWAFSSKSSSSISCTMMSRAGRSTSLPLRARSYSF